MELDTCYTIDCSKSDGDNNGLFDQLRDELITHGYVKVKCENIPNEDCDKACLDVINSVGGVCCPYNDGPQAFIWPVKVLELDTSESKLQASQLDRELVFHTDCSYEHNAPRFVALYFVQCDRTEKGGKFQMVRTKHIVDKLSPETKRLLRNETFKINVPPDFRKGDIDYISGYILLDGDEHIRYRRDIVNKQQLKEETPEKQMAIAELNSIILAEDTLPVFRPTVENNMMVMFNNARFVHGRTKIEDIERYLLRVRFNIDN
jgi:alpha-ketoglutarate-dependent taurine dioxygenase